MASLFPSELSQDTRFQVAGAFVVQSSSIFPIIPMHSFTVRGEKKLGMCTRDSATVTQVSRPKACMIRCFGVHGGDQLAAG